MTGVFKSNWNLKSIVTPKTLVSSLMQNLMQGLTGRKKRSIIRELIFDQTPGDQCKESCEFRQNKSEHMSMPIGASPRVAQNFRQFNQSPLSQPFQGGSAAALAQAGKRLLREICVDSFGQSLFAYFQQSYLGLHVHSPGSEVSFAVMHALKNCWFVTVRCNSFKVQRCLYR